MIKYINNNRGSSLIMIIVIMAIMMILSTTIMKVALAENNFAVKQENKLKAYYIARAGAQSVTEYMIHNPNGDAEEMLDKVSDWNEQIGGGKFQVSVEHDTDNNVVNITSTGEYRNQKQEAKIRITTSSNGVGGIFDHAIAARSDITVDSNGNKTVIDGSVATKEGVIDIDKAESGDQIVDPDLVFPPIEEPDSYDFTYGDIDLNGGPGIEIDSDINDPDPVHVYTKSITLKNTSIKITGSGVVHMYVDGNINLETSSSFDVADDAKLYIYVIGTRTVKLIGNGAQNNIFLYAPDSDILWNNSQPNNDVRRNVF